jgi:hypothetical protein
LADRYHVKYTDFLEYIVQLKKSGDTGILKNEILDLYKTTDSVLDGNSHRLIMPEFGPIYWEREEASFLSISNNKEVFYNELHKLVQEYLEKSGIVYNKEELSEVIEYQKARVPDHRPLKKQEYHFKYNIPEYFDTYFLENRSLLSSTPQTMTLTNPKDYKDDKKSFAKEIILYGRKSNVMLYSVQYKKHA